MIKTTKTPNKQKLRKIRITHKKVQEEVNDDEEDHEDPNDKYTNGLKKN